MNESTILHWSPTLFHHTLRYILGSTLTDITSSKIFNISLSNQSLELFFQVDGNIKSMYQLMAKVEELNKSMAPAYKLAEQVIFNSLHAKIKKKYLSSDAFLRTISF